MNQAAPFIGYLASALVFATFWMKAPIRLRQVAIVSNIVFFTYGVLAHAYPVAVLHFALFPLNIIRLVEIKRLATKINTAHATDLSIEWLRPFGSLRRYDTSSLLFHKGEQSAEAHVILSGRVDLPEIGVTLNSGALVGEMAAFTPLQQRTLSARCVTDVETLVVSGDALKRVFYQNREFGAYLLRLITGRLVENSASVGPVGSVDQKARQLAGNGNTIPSSLHENARCAPAVRV